MPPAAIEQFSDFVAGARVPAEARAVAAAAFLDTIGVMLAGAAEPAARAVQEVARTEGGEPHCRIIGTSHVTGPSWAALANGTAAHALDYDDMCFVSLAHPSAPLVAAALAAGELARAPGRVLVDAWVVGFEIEAVLGRAMNPRHYTQGWHCTSTIGTLGAAATAARLLGLDRDATAQCLSVAASEASGLKENFGTDAKPLHAGLAARNGIVAALLARSGLTASNRALEGPQGFLVAMGSQRADLGDTLEELGHRWEVLETGVTIKLYPSCAGTHPALDTILDLKRQHGFTTADVESIAIGVDAVTPTILIYDRPTTGLQGKFSMQYCAAAAVVMGRVGLDTFESAVVNDARIGGLLPRITMTVDSTLRTDAPALTQARVTIKLGDGRTLTAYADGARGYPARLASAQELTTKFRECAGRVLDPTRTDAAIRMLQLLDQLAETRDLTDCLSPGAER
ncbi:MAG: MmgE/PrpD family protein [Gemmatimonadetes bacterium]|nr:MmgE/PrpD family protein [Gemmatimonadota bacterium]